MKIVLDANIVKGYYEENVLGLSQNLTGPASQVLDRVENKVDKLVLDDHGHIINEWKTPVDSEWFRAWYIQLLDEQAIIKIKVNKYHHLIKKLNEKGFPKSKDIWYIRTSKTWAELNGEAIIVSEDIDFFDPSKKQDRARKKTMLKGNGPIVRILKKNAIKVFCVCSYLEQV